MQSLSHRTQPINFRQTHDLILQQPSQPIYRIPPGRNCRIDSYFDNGACQARRQRGLAIEKGHLVVQLLQWTKLTRQDEFTAETPTFSCQGVHLLAVQ